MKKKDLKARPPIVTLMGHVDHGKTSLLDAIRKSNIAGGEFGQITQHIGAYTVSNEGRRITFLDTPGHEAFTNMRARGAQLTDIVILVISVEEGVMPQTVEAISHCQAAQVPIIVALNKVDRGRENIPRIKGELARHNLLSEDLGGQALFVETSAAKRTGIGELLEAILLQSEMLELKADYACPAEGVVIETRMDRGTGANISLVVLNGILRNRDHFTVGDTWGRVRAIFDDAGKPMKEVTPGLAARVIGLSQLPPVASRFKVVDSEKTAREFCETNLARPEAGTVSTPITLEEFYQRLQAEGAKDLNIILKADVAGSMEAIAESLQRLNTEELKVRILHSGIGPVGEADVLLAKTSGSIVLAFNVNIDPKARETVRQENVQVRQYRIIYDLLDDVRKSLSGLLEPELKEVVTGRVQIKQIFKLSSGQLAIGCSVLEGKVNRGGKARLMRGDKAVAEVIVASLRRFKENVREVTAGYECGLTLDGADEALPGDQLVIYRIEEITRSL